MFLTKRAVLPACLTFASLLCAPTWGATPEPCAELGIFEGRSDVGIVALPGTTVYDCEAEKYRVTGSGADIWGHEDAFHFVWRRLSGDGSLSARVGFVGSSQHRYRKAGWMFRESLDADAAYVDAVVHGDGLISLQYRETAGGPTGELRASLAAPATLRLVREGDRFTLWLGKTGLPFEKQGSIHVDLPDEPYVGLAVCSRESSRSETAIFSEAEIGPAEADEPQE